MRLTKGHPSRVLNREDCQPQGFRWLTLKRLTWEDPLGRQRIWESAERTTRRGSVDGVAIIAKVLRSGQLPCIPLVSQFRPPLEAECLELPAGLVDAGETPAEAAVRELREETGYSGRVVAVSDVAFSDPGMSNANMVYVLLEVDGDARGNCGADQHLEDGEFITLQLAPWGPGLLEHLQEQQRRTGCQVDARLLSYAWGMAHAAEAGSSAAAAAAQPQAALMDGARAGPVLPRASPLAPALLVEATASSSSIMGHAQAGKPPSQQQDAVAGGAAALPEWLCRAQQQLVGTLCDPRFWAGAATALLAAAALRSQR